MQSQTHRWRRAGVRVSLVPTMGYLHEGHLSLVRRARKEVGPTGRVVVSIYVNPTQFGAGEDFSRYPRDLGRDRRLCVEAGVDVVFAPSDSEMYRTLEATPCTTTVVEEELVKGMEGASRPAHFRGVTTVVAKLFNLVCPNVAVFGAKDYQQAAVVRRMVRDLCFPVKVVVGSTVRERDGLALSSRNAYLSREERREAAVLYQVWQFARRRVRKARGKLSAGRLRDAVVQRIGGCSQARVDYVAFVDPETLAPLKTVGRGAHLALAVWIGKTRLIDNGRL